ncbi:hypothetical protein [Geofilum rubicundum]|uniref:hypothetical protein n=1 Tax=Geofilum rubicundum TaxID=472113 RepID=UPI0012F900B3|nr:hypothetical protein [Geofilum rubicundum]
MIHLVCRVIIHALCFKWTGLQQRHACFRLVLFNKVIYMGRVFSPFVISTFLLLVGFSGGMSAQMYEDTWQSVKTYPAQPGINLAVNNKYGSVLVTIWDRDSVKIEVTRKIFEKSRDRLNTLRDNIDIDYQVFSNGLSVETVFGSRHSSLVRDLREMANLSLSDSRSRIDYKIYLPAHANLKITNKYGNVVLPSMDGKVNVDLSNGDFQARDLNGEVNLTLAFGKAILGHLKKGVVSLNFVDFSGEHMEQLQLEGRSSEIKIQSVDVLDLTSRRDKVEVAKAGSVVADGYFSSLKFLEVERQASLKLTYGELTHMVLTHTIQQCDIVSQTCNVNLTLLNPLPYRARVRQTRGSISLPASVQKGETTSQMRNDLDFETFFFGRKDAANKFNINISDSELKINHQ